MIQDTNTPSAVMLFAAGFGTRMGKLTQDRPKPLIPVAGRPLIDHALELTDHLPIRVVNAHYRAEQIQTYLRGRAVAVSLEEPDILDTGGGLRHALPYLGQAPVFTLNTDAVWHGPNPLAQLAEVWNPDQMDALLLCVPLVRATGRKGGGDFSLGPEGRLIRMGGLVYTGAQIVKTDLLATIPERAFSLNVIWNRMAEAGRLMGLEYSGRWADVGHPKGIGQAEDMLND